MNVETVAEKLFYNTVRIDTLEADGSNGSGTGFLYEHTGSDGLFYPFLVTNKHVVAGTEAGWIMVHQGVDGRPRGEGFRLQLRGWHNGWFGHPDPDVDITVLPFRPIEDALKVEDGIDIYRTYIGTTQLATERQLAELDAIESVTFIGYPNGIWDTKNLLPVARRGTTATPLEVDFENTPRFLIDASVFGGSSGSPVFILNQGSYSSRNGSFTQGTRLIFVGVIAAVFQRTALNEIVAVPIPTHTRPMARQFEMIDLGIVFKARTVVETIEAWRAKYALKG